MDEQPVQSQKQQEELYAQFIDMLRQVEGISDKRADQIEALQMCAPTSVRRIKLSTHDLSEKLYLVLCNISFPNLEELILYQQGDMQMFAIQHLIFKNLLPLLRIKILTLRNCIITPQAIAVIFSQPLPHLIQFKTQNCKICHGCFQAMFLIGHNLANLQLFPQKCLEMSPFRLMQMCEMQGFPWPRLNHLEIFSASLSRFSLIYLKKLSEWAPLVKRLDIRNNHISELGPKLLLEAQWIYLQHLNINNNEIGERGAQYLSQGNWPRLTKLMLASNKIKDKGVQHISKGKWSQLARLDLENNYFGVDGCKGLVSADWKQLRTLDLERNLIDESCLEVLVKANWPNLEELDISDCLVDDYAMIHLQNHPWSKLKILQLHQKANGTAIGPDGIDVFLQGFYNSQSAFLGLTELDLSNNVVSDFGFRCITCMDWPQLQSLKLENNQLGDQSMPYLYQSNWPKLRVLNLAGNKFRERSLRDLWKTCWQELETIKIGLNKLGIENVQEMLYFGKDAHPRLSNVNQSVNSEVMWMSQVYEWLKREVFNKRRYRVERLCRANSLGNET